MALHPSSFPYDITVALPDLVIDGTTIKRKGSLITMQFNPMAKSVILNVQVQPFAADPMATDGFGVSLAGTNGFSTWQRNIVADLTSLVKQADGSLVTDANGKTLGPEIFHVIDNSTAGQAKAASLGLPYVYVDQFAPGGLLYDSVANAPKEVQYEYDFYNDVAHAVPVTIADMIKGKMQAATY